MDNKELLKTITVTGGMLAIGISGAIAMSRIPNTYESQQTRNNLYQTCMQVKEITKTESRIAMHEIMALDHYPDFEKDPELKRKMENELLKYGTKYEFWDQHTSRLVHLCTIDPERFERDYSGITSCKDFVSRYNTLNRDLKSINPLELCI
jgi:hypothetical protein